MKILHTIAGFGAKSGGTSTATYDLLSNLNDVASGLHRFDILAPDVNTPGDRIMGNGDEWIKIVPNDCISPLGYSANMKKALATGCYDVYHTNGLWLYTNHITCVTARRMHRPYVITPHGMLYPEALRRSYWKKWPLLHLWFKKDIMHADCIHATCEDEMQHLRDFGYKGAIALIANPVPLNSDADKIFLTRKTSIGARPHDIRLGFLGRLHPRKNVEAIIHAMALRNDVQSSLTIIGKGDEAYEAFLHNEVDRLGLKGRVEFAGFITGRQKYEILSSLSALFVPSDMENFGMIIPEALMVGTPVMASLGTPWKSLNEHNCGWWTDNSPESIARVIDRIAASTPSELFEMGARGREMVISYFAADKVAANMLRLYEWLTAGGEKPQFVHTL